MKRKLMALLLALVMCFGLASCAGNSSSVVGDNSENTGSNGETSASSATDEDVPHVVFGMYCGSEYKDMDMIDEAVSAYTLEHYGFTVETIPITAANYSDTVMLMMLGEEKLDLLTNGSLALFDLVNWTNQGMLEDMSDLVDEYGDGIKEVLGDYLDCGRISGGLYLLPRKAEMAKAQGFTFNKQMVEDAGIDVEAIQSLEDMTEVLQTLKETYPSVTPMGVAASAESIARYFYGVDNMGDETSGVLLNYGQDDDLTVVNLYETDEYRNIVTLVNEWYKAGYISADVNSNQDEAQAQLGAGTIACYPNDLKPGVNESDEARTGGVEVVSVQLTEAVAYTSTICNFGYSITSYSDVKEEAMQLLNLIYSDEYIHNLYCYGIEGVHWQWTDESKTTITFADGVDASTSGYYPGSNFLYGNLSLSYLWEGNPETLYEDTENWANEALISRAAGFIFDPSNVETEYAAISSVCSEYAKALGNGAVDDVEATLQTFNDKLYQAGLQTVLEEKQRQLDEWLEENEK